MPRLRRKDEHIYLSLAQKPALANFSDIYLVHNCLPEIDLHDVTLETDLLGLNLRSPLFINAVTGGTPLARRINVALAQVARQCGLPMAIGSQMAALEHPSTASTFSVVRSANPDGIIWANLGAYATVSQARKAVEMIDASAVQIHLNVPQELVMGEGDYNFKGRLQRIEAVVKSVGVPVIVKEVGFGIAAEQALALLEAGVSAIDVGGKGGTNFIAIEARRSRRIISPGLMDWGLPTPVSLAEVINTVQDRIDVIAAGGMASGINAAKALALGAKAVGLAGFPVYILLTKGRRSLLKAIKDFEHELRLIMLMAGAASIKELQKVPLVITGFTAEWLTRRGIDPTRLSHPSRR